MDIEILKEIKEADINMGVEKIITILSEAGMGLDDLVKINVYLINMSEFEKFSKVRDSYLMQSKPASTVVEISGTATKGCDVEIDAIAIKNKR